MLYAIQYIPYTTHYVHLLFCVCTVLLPAGTVEGDQFEDVIKNQRRTIEVKNWDRKQSNNESLTNLLSVLYHTNLAYFLTRTCLVLFDPQVVYGRLPQFIRQAYWQRHGLVLCAVNQECLQMTTCGYNSEVRMENNYINIRTQDSEIHKTQTLGNTTNIN